MAPLPPPPWRPKSTQKSWAENVDFCPSITPPASAKAHHPLVQHELRLRRQFQEKKGRRGGVSGQQPLSATKINARQAIVATLSITRQSADNAVYPCTPWLSRLLIRRGCKGFSQYKKLKEREGRDGSATVSRHLRKKISKEKQGK